MPPEGLISLIMGKNLSIECRSDTYKIWFDLSLMVLVHLTLFPVWIILWTKIPLMIWLNDRGPIFYRQQRAGKDGGTFTILKFRTMIPNADLKGPTWTTKDDPRITRIGRILRRTALDELPGELSIWKGDMSLVGPRALDVNEHRDAVRQFPGFEERLRVRPGLTGLAQVYDKEDKTEIKLTYDLQYLAQMGPGLDLKLLALSVKNTFTGNWDKRSGKQTAPNLNLQPKAASETIQDSLTADLKISEIRSSESDQSTNDGI